MTVNPSLKKFKVIIFDLDGVLYNSTDSWIKTMKKIAEQLHDPFFKMVGYQRLFGKSAKALIRAFFSKKYQEKATALFFYKERKRFLSGFKLFPGTKQTLKYLRNKNIKIAIATGLDRNALNVILNKDNLLKFIDVTLTSEEVKKEKPNPEILLQILRKLKLKPAEGLYIGDAVFDIKTAKRAKMEVAIIKGTAIRNKKKAREMGADYVFSNLFELFRAMNLFF
jgi:beta-phosphoglucomutase